MSKRVIEETFRAIVPRTRRGIPNPPVIAVGLSSTGGGGISGVAGGGDLASSLSQAGQQIAGLKSAYQQQSALISANTQAIQSNTSAQGSHAGSSAGQVASSLLGGALGFLSPVISGIASLFGGGSSAPAPLPFYVPPAAIQINGSLASPGATGPAATATSSVTPVAHSLVSGELSASVPQAPSLAQSLLSNVSSPSTPQTFLSAQSLLNSGASPSAPQASGPVQPANSGQLSGVQNITVNISAMDSQSFMDRSNDIANAVRAAMLNMHPINNVITNL